MNRLEAIRQREQAATEGPWVASPHERFTDHFTIYEPRTGQRTDDPSGSVVYGPVLSICDSWADDQPSAEDAAFIAHARTDIPALLAVVEAAARVVADSEVVWDGGRGEWRWQTSDGRVPESVVALRAALAPLLEPEG